MPEYLENPRRVPREPVRCRARLLLSSGALDTTTEDIGSRGCQLVIPAVVQRGDVIGLSLSAPRYEATLRVEGRVAWVSPRPPWHVGIAYAAQALPGAARWMEGLRQAAPDLFPAGRRPPERLAVDAMVFLATVPRLADFREDELVVLRAVGAGVRVGDLRTKLSRTWPRMQRALFTLVAQGYVILSRAAAAHPVTWKRILGEPDRAGSDGIPLDGCADAHLAVVSERSGREAGPPAQATPRAPGPAPSAPRPTVETPVVPQAPVSRRAPNGVDAHVETPLATPVVTARPPPLPPGARTDPGSRTARPAPDFVGAGVGWRAPTRPRLAEAEALYNLALVEMESHREHQALVLLRRALSMAPGDPEIAGAIGRAMLTGGGGAP